MPVVSALAQLEHACRIAMKYAVSTGFSIHVLQKLLRKRSSLNKVSLPPGVCNPMTRILLLRSGPGSLWSDLYRTVHWIFGDQLYLPCYQN